jgi:hypothetical protein
LVWWWWGWWGNCSRDVVALVRMGSKTYQGGLLLHFHVGDHVVEWRVLMGLCHGALVECRGLVGELVGRKRLGVLGLHGKGIDILEVVRVECMVIEAVEMGGRSDLAGVDSAFGRGQ